MRYNIAFIVFFLCQNVLGQDTNANEFQVIAEREAEIFLKSPLEAKKQALFLNELAVTNKEKIIAYHYLGNIYEITGKVDSARYYFQKQLNLSKEFFYGNEIYYQSFIDYVNWGKNYLDSNVLIDNLTKVLLQINTTEFPKQKKAMYLLMCDLLLKQNELEKANDYIEKAFTIIEGDIINEQYYLRKGEIAVNGRNYLIAKENFILGLEFFNDKEVYNYALFLNKLGYVYLLLGDINNSNQYLYESLYYQNKNGFLNLSSNTYLNLYYLSKVQQNDRLERFNLDKALETNKGDVQTLKNIYLAYKEYYSGKGDLVSSNENLLKFNKINDSISNAEKVNLGIVLESKFRLRENKKELELKEKIIQKELKFRTFLIIGFIVLTVLLIGLIGLYFLKLKAQKKLRNNQKLLHEEQLKFMLENQRTEIIKEKVKAKLEERSKLSLELHDGIANDIGALKVSLTNDNMFNATNINLIVDKIDKLYNEVRDWSHDLNSDKILDIEFSQLINSLCIITEKNGIKTTKNILITEKINTLDDSFLLNIYRILQETINNVLKHANATEIQLDIIQLDTELLLIIKDNGVGFSVNAIKTGIGLKNIEKRVDSLNGKLNIISSGNGTTIDIKLPL